MSLFGDWDAGYVELFVRKLCLFGNWVFTLIVIVSIFTHNKYIYLQYFIVYKVHFHSVKENHDLFYFVSPRTP